MGERISVGKLTFVVLESKWDSHLGDLGTARLPKHQFLQVRLSVTNGGGANDGFPFLSVLDEQGNRTSELEDGKGVTDWLGLIRIVGAGETLMGWTLFDVPQADYNLQLSDGKLENEQTAIVEIPFRIG